MGLGVDDIVVVWSWIGCGVRVDVAQLGSASRDESDCLRSELPAVLCCVA